MSTTFQNETAVVRRSFLLSRLCAVNFFSSRGRSSTGDVPLVARSHVACISSQGKNKAVNQVGGLTSELHNRMQQWECRMETQMKTQIQQHWDIFEKKWEEQIVEPESERDYDDSG